MFSSPASSPATSSNDAAQLPLSFTALRNTVQAGGEHLGDVVWWMLSGADVQRSVLETKWLAAGLDPKYMPQPQTPEKALRLAVRAASTNLGSQRQGTLVRPTVDSDNALIFAVVQEGHDASGNYFSTQKALVMLDLTKDSGGVPANTVTTDNPSDDTASLILKEYHRYADTHTSRDIMGMIVKVLKDTNAVTLRETGGIYWVPRTKSDEVRKLQNAVEQLGNSLVFILPVHKTADSERSLGMAAAGSIEAELGTLRDEIAGFVSDPNGVRAGTLDRRLATFEDLRGRAELYRSILGVTVEDLEGQLHLMQMSVETLLAQKRA